MPIFSYVAVGRDGRSQNGEEFADSRSSLERQLRSRRLVVVECKERRRRKAAIRPLTRLIGQLSRLLSNGVAVDRALQIIEQGREEARVSELAHGIRAGIKRGLSLSQAFDSVAEFDTLVIPLIKAGEASGQLPTILDSLRIYLEGAEKLRRDVAAALAYPAVLVASSVFAVIGLGAYVVPIFKDLFGDRMNELPGTTAALFAISDILTRFGGPASTVIIAVAVLSALLISRSPQAQASIDHALLSLPILGGFLATTQASTLTSVLGILLEHKVPLATAVELAAGSVTNRHFREGVRAALSEIRKGKRFAVALECVDHFPVRSKRMMVVGEETGQLGSMCVSVSLMLKEEAQATVKAAVSLLEPVIILFMGAAVGFVVISMLLGVYSMSSFGA